MSGDRRDEPSLRPARPRLDLAGFGVSVQREKNTLFSDSSSYMTIPPE